MWKLFIDNASNRYSARLSIILIFDHRTFNHTWAPSIENKAEYEALLARLKSAFRLKASELMVYSNSELVVNQVFGEYEAKGNRMAKYQTLVREEIKKFLAIRVEQIDHERNN